MQYVIPANRVRDLHTGIAALGRRADRLGLPRPSYVLGGECTGIAHVWEDYTDSAGRKSSRLVRRLYPAIAVEVEGLVIRLSGWTFIARSMPTGAEALLLGPDLGEVAMPAEYREHSSACDHCRVARVRKDMYIVRNDEGVFRRVGRSCLADFVGCDSPEVLADMLQASGGLLRALSGEDEGWLFSEKTQRGDLVREWVATAIEFIDHGGFFPAGSDRSTRSAVAMALNPPRGREDERHVPSAAYLARADEMIAWAVEQLPSAPTGSYAYNVGVAAKATWVLDKTTGLLTSLPVAYSKAMGLAASARVKKPSHHVGTPGDKVVIEAEVVRTHVSESAFGARTLLQVRTDDGAVFVWWASMGLEGLERRAGADIVPGRRVRVVGVVKAHETYRDEPQTQLTRCKVQAA